MSKMPVIRQHVLYSKTYIDTARRRSNRTCWPDPSIQQELLQLRNQYKRLDASHMLSWRPCDW